MPEASPESLAHDAKMHKISTASVNADINCFGLIVNQSFFNKNLLLQLLYTQAGGFCYSVIIDAVAC